MTRRVSNGILLLATCLILSACATGAGLSDEFERSVKTFNRMLRWHEIESAGRTYIDPALEKEYLKQADYFKKRGLSVTDFRILSSRYLPENKTGDVVAEFDYYLLPSGRVKTISYPQEWVYLESIKSWKLKSVLPPFE